MLYKKRGSFGAYKQIRGAVTMCAVADALKAEGRLEGHREGVLEGRLEGKIEILLEMNFTVTEIADLLEISVERTEEIAAGISG